MASVVTYKNKLNENFTQYSSLTELKWLRSILDIIIGYNFLKAGKKTFLIASGRREQIKWIYDQEKHKVEAVLFSYYMLFACLFVFKLRNDNFLFPSFYLSCLFLVWNFITYFFFLILCSTSNLECCWNVF